MYNIQFSLSDMKRRWFELFFIVIQMTIAMLLFCYSISIILDGMKAIDILESSKIKSYDFKLTVNVEEKDSNKIDKQDIGKLNAIYKIVNDSKYSNLVVMDNSTQFSISDDLIKNKGLDNVVLKNDSINYMMVNNNFFNFFGLDKNYKKLLADKKSAILGNQFRKYFKIGDYIEDGNGERFKIKGFFRKGEFFVNPFQENNTVTLNDFMVTSFRFSKNISSLDYISFLDNSLILPKNEILKNKIIKKINKFNLRYINMERISDEIIESRKDIYNAFITIMVIAVLILFFSSVTLITNIIQYIQDNLREFAVNMICGGSRRDILLRIGIQIIIMEIFSFLSLFIVFGLDYNVLISCGVLFLYGIIAMIYPMRIFSRQQIVNIMRKN